MPAATPRYCRPAAYACFAQAVARLDADDRTAAGLVDAATAISMHALRDAEPGFVTERLDALGIAARRELRSSSLRARLAHLHHVLFDDMGFAGNRADYYAPANSYLPSVLATRRGIPISLALIYKAVAVRVGLDVDGVGAPGHFLVRVADEAGAMLVDPFHRGRILSEEDAFRLMEVTLGTVVPRAAELLPIVPPREWLARMLRNLETIHTHRAQARDAAAMAELRRLVEAPETGSAT